MVDLRLYLLGTPRIEYQGQPVKLERRKALGLAAYLALAEAPQSREALAGLLWPELDDDHARSSLRTTLRALNAAAPVEWIQADRATLALKPDAVWVDVRAFLDLLAGGSSHGHELDTVCEHCVDLHRQAAELYRADFLAGYTLTGSAEYDDWQLTQREWLRRELAGVQRRLSHYYATAGQYEPAIRHAGQWLGVDSLHEPAHRQLMRLYAASGQRSEALRQYKQCVAVLDAELATPPEAETVQLYEAIQNDRFVPDQKAEPGASASGVMPPLPALVVGRDDALAEIKRRLGIDNPSPSLPVNREGVTPGSPVPPPLTSDQRKSLWEEARRGSEITIIQGWPGVGKSTIVARLAHDADVTRQFPDGVLWASLGENPNLLGEVSAWADALKLYEPGRVRKIEELSAQLTAVLRDRRALLIVDDIWGAEHAAPFRVGGQNCALVMTTRLNDVAVALASAPGDIYRLPVLSESAALELLGKLAPDTLAQHPAEARQLVADLEGLPLAIHVAGRLLQSESRMGWGVGDLLAELRAGSSLLQAQPPSDMLGVGRDTSPTVAALLRRSTDLLNPETRQRFAYLGLFVPKPATFDLEAMAVAWDVADPRPIARLLINRGLLEPVSGGRFQMHALLVLHARSLLREV